MSLQTKKRLAATLLALCVVWPGIHHALARTYDFDPWKFFGWSMYAVPNPSVDVTVGRIDQGRLEVVVLEGALATNAAQFASRRAVLGRWLAPDELARQVLAEHPRVDRLVVRVRHWIVDRETARFRPVHDDYGYSRNPP